MSVGKVIFALPRTKLHGESARRRVGRIGSLAPTTILPQPFFRIGNSADLASSSPLRPSTMPPPPPAENKRNKKVVTGWMAEVGRRGGEFMASVLDLLLV